MFDVIEARHRALGPDFRPPPGVPRADLDAFERAHGVRLPAALRAFYARFDGLPHGECGGFIFHFYPLAELHNVLLLDLMARGSPNLAGIADALPGAASTFVFADLMIGSVYYAVRLSPDPDAPDPVLEISPGPHWREHSPSFAEFLRRLAEEPHDVPFG